VHAGDVRTAVSLLTPAVQAHPGELRLREQWEEAHLTDARQRLQIARRQAQHTAHPQAQRLVSQLEDDVLRHEIEFFSMRARRYPLETQWSLELAIRLKRSGNYAEAVRLLREVPADNPRSARVAFEIGECLQFQRRFREALESYTEAVRQISLLPPTPTEDWERTALYRAGTLAHDLGFLDQAADCLRQLVKLAPDHEDVQQRLDKLADIRHKD
jgi:tetratricopeptide (TPR) repeat protein